MAHHDDIATDKDTATKEHRENTLTETSYESRLLTSRSEDIEKFIPEDAEPLFGDGNPSTPPGSPIFTTDDFIYNTGVYCSQCYCDVAETDQKTGVVSCPNCSWSSETTD